MLGGALPDDASQTEPDATASSSQSKYDWVLLTRFDLSWRMPLSLLNISEKHLNVMSELDGPTQADLPIDDNIYVFPA